MNTESNPALLRLLLAFAAVGCGVGAVITVALLAVNVLG